MQKKDSLDLQQFAGEEADTTGAELQPDAGAEKQGEGSFELLLKENPEYKAAYDARVKRAIDGRFRQLRQLEERSTKADLVLSALAQKYGLSWKNGDDTQPLLERLTDEAKTGREEAVGKLRDQVIAMRRRNPSFRMEEEMKNPTFGRMLAHGVPVEAAYELAHRPEAIAQAMSYAITRTRQAMADQMRSGGRPQENGLTPRISPQTTPDPKNLTRQERKNLRDRVAKGEKVYW